MPGHGQGWCDIATPSTRRASSQKRAAGAGGQARFRFPRALRSPAISRVCLSPSSRLSPLLTPSLVSLLCVCVCTQVCPRRCGFFVCVCVCVSRCLLCLCVSKPSASCPFFVRPAPSPSLSHSNARPLALSLARARSPPSLPLANPKCMDQSFTSVMHTLMTWCKWCKWCTLKNWWAKRTLTHAPYFDCYLLLPVTCTRKEGIIEAIERERFRNEPQLRLTRTAEHEEDQPVAARKRKASGGGKTAKSKALESDRSSVQQEREGRRKARLREERKPRPSEHAAREHAAARHCHPPWGRSRNEAKAARHPVLRRYASVSTGVERCGRESSRDVGGRRAEV